MGLFAFPNASKDDWLDCLRLHLRYPFLFVLVVNNDDATVLVGFLPAILLEQKEDKNAIMRGGVRQGLSSPRDQ